MPQTNVEELLSRTCYEATGTKVINCVIHLSLPLTARPADCRLCCADVQNRLSDAIAVNAWLNQWKDDASAVLLAQLPARTGNQWKDDASAVLLAQLPARTGNQIPGSNTLFLGECPVPDCPGQIFAYGDRFKCDGRGHVFQVQEPSK